MEPKKTGNVSTYCDKNDSYVWETESGTLIDLVYDMKDVTNEYFMFIPDIPKFLDYMQKEKTIHLTKKIAKNLLKEGILRRKL